MSINHFTTPVPESFWRTEPLRYDPGVGDPPVCIPTGFDFNLNRHGYGYEEAPDRDPLFEKTLTPSDVGKLNRLVIPKQHAERCFPVVGLWPADADSGMQLSFEDESGKCWRFRYSYWSSSQSYVLTKGWSRYVKEKRLEAGDIVLFERHRVDGDRLFIRWRRGTAEAAAVSPSGGRGWTGAVAGNGYEAGAASVGPDHGANHAGSAAVDRMQSSGNSKKFRLFGVNLEYRQQQSDADSSQQHYHYSDTYHGSFNNSMGLGLSTRISTD